MEEEIKTEEVKEEVIAQVVEPVAEIKIEKKKGLFSKIKGFFEKKVDEKIDKVIEVIEEQPKPVVYGECFFCGQEVYKTDKWSKQQSRLFHRPCYKKFLQAGKNGKI